MRKTVVVIGCGLFQLSVLAVPSLTAPTTVPAAPGAKKVDPRMVDALIQQGSDALTVGDAKVARDAFADAVQLDKKNVKALHGLGIAYYQLRDLTKASAAFEGALAVPGSLDHALVYNSGIVFLQNKVPMRAAKIARDFLNSNPNPIDEPVANVIGLALERADTTTQKNEFYAGIKTFYDRYVKRMETANVGYLRWGPDWLPAEDVKTKQKINADLQPTITGLQKEYADLDKRLTDSRKKLATLEMQISRAMIEQWAADPVKEEVRSLEERRDRKKVDLDTALGQLIKPDPLPDLTATVPMDSTAPALKAPASKVVAVAKADNTVTEPGDDGGSTPKPRSTYATRKLKKPKPVEGTDPANPNDPAQKPAEKPIEPPVAEQPAEVPPVAETPAPRKKIRLTMYAAAFPVASDLVITSAAAVDSTHDISLQVRDGTVLTGTLVRSDAKSGLALVRVKGVKLLFFNIGDAAAGAVSCAAFPEVNLFAPEGELIAGTAPAPSGTWTVNLKKHPRLAGAPLIQNGKVVGVELGSRDNDKASIPAATAAAIKELLGADQPASATANPDPIYSILQLSAVKDRE